MGPKFSEPIPDLRSCGYVCITLRYPNKCNLIHAPPHLVDAIVKVVKELGQSNVTVKFKYGADQISLPGRPFLTGSLKESANIGKMFIISLLELMQVNNYEFLFSSDLTQMWDQSSLFFKKSSDMGSGRAAKRVICIAPGGKDRLILMNHSQQITDTVRESIKAAWHYGIKMDEQEVYGNITIHEFKLNGTPWHSEQDQSVGCRKVLLEIITRMAGIGFRLHANVNIKGGTDSMFFIQSDEIDNSRPQFAILSPNRTDRLRLINFEPWVAQIVNETIMKFFQTSPPAINDYHGSTEFTLKGNPFYCSGDEAVLTRELFCRIFEALSSIGWKVITTLDISRKETEKSIFILEKKTTQVPTTIVSSISMTDVSKICIISFPTEIKEILRQVIISSYKPGIASEKSRSPDCHQIVLAGRAWTHYSSFGLHSKSMLLQVLKEANLKGWNLIASADVSAKSFEINDDKYPYDVHSWFFSYNENNEQRHPEMNSGFNYDY